MSQQARQRQSVSQSFDNTERSTEFALHSKPSPYNLRRRRLAEVALPFLMGHRSLAFALGQTMHLLAPLAGLVGISQWTSWATLLSKPNAAAFWLGEELM
jgi:hypothetical protein